MQWLARDDRHSSEVFRVFGVKFQFRLKPAETPTVQVRHVTEQIHFAVFSNPFFKRRSYRNHVLWNFQLTSETCPNLGRKSAGSKSLTPPEHHAI